jgi:predicted RNA-binding protein with TRAM domain
MSVSKPVQEGGEYEVEIKEIGRKDDGVARVEGFVVYVPGAKIGDRLRVRIEHLSPTYATGAILEHLTPQQEESAEKKSKSLQSGLRAAVKLPGEDGWRWEIDEERTGDSKKCPSCGTWNRLEAWKCGKCQREFFG